MSTRVPNFREPGLTDFLTRQQEERDRMLRDKLSTVTANEQVLLYSPSKKVYAISVDDAGVISATLVSG